MFGYVKPCRMELKIKDYEKFKAYYCGLCIAIKKNYGNILRLTLNYDMTFLAVLLDGLNDKKITYVKKSCILHPVKKRIIAVNNNALNYASFLDIILSYYKTADDIHDDKKISSFVFSLFFKSKMKYISNDDASKYVSNKISALSRLEKSQEDLSLDDFSNPFAELTAYIISEQGKSEQYYNDLKNLGYHLGRWIYIMDALDDLENDMAKNKFNAINKALNKDNLPFKEFLDSVSKRLEFTILNLSSSILGAYKKLPIKKNSDLIYNILQYGLMETYLKTVKKERFNNEQPL